METTTVWPPSRAAVPGAARALAAQVTRLGAHDERAEVDEHVLDLCEGGTPIPHRRADIHGGSSCTTQSGVRWNGSAVLV